MSKLLKNTTGNIVSITDTGISIPASPGSYLIPPQDYLLWAASSNIVTKVGDGSIIVNDGSSDLSISDGIDLIKGIFPSDSGVLVSSLNSSSANLASSATFTGTWEDISTYSDITLFVYTTEDSTLICDFSTDGITLHRSISYAIEASSGAPHKLARVAKYARVRLTNNGNSTATVALQTIYAKQGKSHLTTNLSATVADYSDAELVRAVLTGRTADGDYENIGIGENEGLKLDLQKTAFGDLIVSQLRPYIIMSAFKGLPERFYEYFTSGTGSSAGLVDNLPGREFKVTSGTSVGGYGVLRSKKVISYKSGIGVLGRFTARFSSPVANSIQRAGFMNVGNELTFGHDGNNGFGIMHRTGGRLEIRKITLTQRATSSQTATITLNGSSYNASVTGSGNSGTIENNAYEIASALNIAGWAAYNIGATIVFYAETIGAKSGTYSISSTGNLAGSFSQVAAGTSATETWHYQSAWNHYTLLSLETSPFVLDPTKGNVFSVQFQYLGYGILSFFIENPETGQPIRVHDIHYANNNIRPSLDLPEFKLGIIAASAGSTTPVTVHSASMSAFYENEEQFPPKVHSTIQSQSGIGTTLTNVLALKKTVVANNILSISDTLLSAISIAAEATNPVVFEVRLNPTFSAATLWESLDEDEAVIATASGGTVSGGELLYAISISKSSNLHIDMQDLAIILSNNDTLSIAARATNGTVAASASAIFGEI